MGPETPCVSIKGKLHDNRRSLGPPVRVRDLLRPPGPPFFSRIGVRGCHVARRHGLERKPSAGRLAHPLHLIQVDKACSAAAVCETAFVRPRCAPRITKVHSAAACAAPAQSPSAALNGCDGTALFHHAAYAASYTARSATLQATPQATPWCRFDKTRHGYAGRKIPTDRTRKSKNKISVACNAIMSVQYVILYYIVGPTCRGHNGHVRASFEI